MAIADLPPPLPDDVLAATGTLPAKPAALVIEGRHVTLRPTDPEADAHELWAISNGTPVTRLGRSVAPYDHDALVWRFMPVGPFAHAEAFRTYAAALAGMPDARSYTVVHNQTGDLLGSLTYLANRPADLKVEIGSIWYTPPAQSSVVNSECCFLLLDLAFSVGYRRVEWKCNALNERSRRAAVRLGFTFEGVQDGHMIAKGRNRDTAWYRILAAEWPERRGTLRSSLERAAQG